MKMKELLMLGLGALGALYLLNLGFGIVEFIPDNAPLIGNLDEFVASLFVLYGLAPVLGTRRTNVKELLDKNL